MHSFPSHTVALALAVHTVPHCMCSPLWPYPRLPVPCSQCVYDAANNVGRKSTVAGTVSRSGVPRFLQMDQFHLQVPAPCVLVPCRADAVSQVPGAHATPSPSPAPQLEMPFTENLLLVKVNDQPGAIAGITAVVAEAGVNVGSVSLGRAEADSHDDVVRASPGGGEGLPHVDACALRLACAEAGSSAGCDHSGQPRGRGCVGRHP